MNRLRVVGLVLGASFLGVFCSELLCRSIGFRDTAGRLLGRGRLLAVAAGGGVYEKDLEDQDFLAASDWIASANLCRIARNEAANAAKVDREFSLLATQFGSERVFLREVRSSGFSIWSLREWIADHIRSLEWLEKQIAAEGTVTESECRNVYDKERALFAQPIRFRASHLFLAAPAEAPPEIVESKRAAIDALALRLSAGETLVQLAAEVSEDEATKTRGGDLGFFSSFRVTPEFFSEIEKLGVGGRSNPFRSRLGFHIVEVTDIRPARQLSFEEVRTEIATRIANERRALIVERLADMLSAATYVRAD